MRRMDRYIDTSEESRASRSINNKDLYENIGSNTRYASFTDVTNANAIDLSSTKNYKTREGYHQMREYQDVVPTPRVKKELEEFKNLYQEHENRVYDINNVLEEARKNRLEKDSLEEKRKLKNTSYNILASLNVEELEKYRQEKKERILQPNESELRELIDTMTSATLAGDINAASDLLSDLMATSIMDKIDKNNGEEDFDSEEDEGLEKNSNDNTDYQLSLSKEVLDLEELKKINAKQIEVESEEHELMKDADADFYTRSMDLSDQDFDLEEEFKEKQLPVAIKILIILIILIVIAAAAYFIFYKI